MSHQTIPWDSYPTLVERRITYATVRFPFILLYCEFNPLKVWSNFEIADMDFWRGPAYSAFFEHLERMGGFYYERWGDAPVHSIAAALFAKKEQIHFFRDIGYRHDPFQRCPQGEFHQNGKCWCDPSDNFGKPYPCRFVERARRLLTGD